MTALEKKNTSIFQIWSIVLRVTRISKNSGRYRHSCNEVNQSFVISNPLQLYTFPGLEGAMGECTRICPLVVP